MFALPFTGIQFIRVGHQHNTELPITEAFDPSDNSICEVTQSFFDFTANHHGDAGVTQGMACDYVFNMGLCCGGRFGLVSGGGNTRYLINPACGTLDNSGWTSATSMPKALAGHASLVYNDEWLISGGYGSIKDSYCLTINQCLFISDTTGAAQNKVYSLSSGGVWTTLDIEMPRARYGHCMVNYGMNQIAILGGRPDADNVRIAEVDIYNFDTQEWLPGPE